MQTSQSIFSRPVRWTLVVLSWLAFSIAAYLAITNITNSSVAGCVVGSHQGCDAVLNSAWSKWIVVPVAMLGLNCYALLAGLSLMLIVLPNPNRWITTAFLLFGTVAGGASLWFIGVQVFAIGDFCLFCLATDIGGIAIGAIAGWSAYRWWSSTPHLRTSGSSTATLSALRSAIPSGTRPTPIAGQQAAPSTGTAANAPAAPRTPSAASARSVRLVGSVASSTLRTFSQPPSMAIAYGGALALLLLLIGGQIVFPAKTHVVQAVILPNTVDLTGSEGNGNSTQTAENPAPHVALRVDTEPKTEAIDQNKSDAPAVQPVNGNGASSSSPEAKRERKITLLGGKLTVDVGDEPLIGSITAPHVVVEMLSYDCSHCRKTNKLVKKALSRYGDQVALVVLVLPLDSQCNRMITNPAGSYDGACTTARTAVALAKLKPGSFRQFHEFLMSGSEKNPPSRTSILSKSFGMVDRVKLQETRDGEDVVKKIASYVDLFELLQQQSKKNKEEFGLPIQILGDHVMSGSVEKIDDIYKAWEEHLGVKPR